MKANHRHCSRPSRFLQQYWCYTLLYRQAHRERKRDGKERQGSKQKEEEEFREKEEEEEGRTVSLSTITKAKKLRHHGMPPKRVRCDIPPASSRQQNVKKKQG